jgi:uncharacterized membrane protein YuzA (DUF378 family)
MKAMDVLTAILLVVGGLNWGLVGLGGIDLVAGLFGPMSVLSRTVYALVGFSAVYQAIRLAGVRERRGALAVSA